MTKLGLLLLMLLVVIPSAFAFTSYNNTGTVNQNFLAGTGIFNQNLVTSIVTSRAFGNDITNIPLVADLDNDGTNEIIVTIGNQVRILNTDLENVALKTLTAGTYTTPVLIDIDNDGFVEIILANELQANISILKWDGTNFLVNITYDVPLVDEGGSERGMIACNNGEDGTEGIKCLLVVVTNKLNDGGNVTAVLFNASDIGTPVVIDTSSEIGLNFCLSAIPVIAVADYDADGRDEFIFTYAAFKGGGDEVLEINYVNDSLDLAFSLEQSTSFSTDFNPVTSGVPSCNADSIFGEPQRNVGKFFTSPLVAEVTGEAGLETIVALSEDANDFNIFVFDLNGIKIDSHPSLFFDADGEIISNVMLANIYGDTGTVEYCVLGHDDDEEELDLLCGSQQTGNLFDSVEFVFDTGGKFNISGDFPKMNLISHMGQHSNQKIDISGEGETDTTELITSYGVFRVNDDTNNGSLFRKTLDIIFTSIVGDSACIVVDAQQEGSEEIICIEGTVISYIDNGKANPPAVITSRTFNPCVRDSIIKVNESLQVSVTVTDQNPSPLDQDDVFSNVSVYFDGTNEISSSIGSTASGQVHLHSFVLNKTITGGTIRMQGWDTVNTDDKDTITQLFTVATSGIRFGDSTCTIETIPPVECIIDEDCPSGQLCNEEERICEEVRLNITGEAEANEGIIGFVEGASNAFKVSPLVLVLLLMLGWTIAVLTTKDKINDSMITMNKVIFMLIGNIFIFIIGTIIGAISFGIMLVITILAIFSIVIWVRVQFTSNNTM